MAPGAAVFEPEEVDVLAAACDLARKTIGEAATEPDARAELARLVHNLGRSRTAGSNRRLATRSDAAALAAEAADLFHYLRGSGSAPIEDRVLKPIPAHGADLSGGATDATEHRVEGARAPSALSLDQRRVVA